MIALSRPKRRKLQRLQSSQAEAGFLLSPSRWTHTTSARLVPRLSPWPPRPRRPRRPRAGLLASSLAVGGPQSTPRNLASTEESVEEQAPKDRSSRPTHRRPSEERRRARPTHFVAIQLKSREIQRCVWGRSGAEETGERCW